MQQLVFIILLILWPSITLAQPVPCPEGYTCVEPSDIEIFLQLAKDHKCRAQIIPKVVSDSVTIIVDEQGRIYSSGDKPYPYTVHIDWCNYQISADSKVKLIVAQREEPTWGFRFRPKATFGILWADLVTGSKVQNALDGGILIDPFYVQWFNVDVFVGVRSTGLGVGVDITKNMGAYLGYSITWGYWRSNPFLSVYFAF